MLPACPIYIYISLVYGYGLEGPGIESRWGENLGILSVRPWGPHNRPDNVYRVFPEGKAAGVWRFQPTSSSAEIKERVELYLYLRL
jgi:hypothetical protein